METVLLVEDVADNARLFERILRAYGFDVVRTEDAASGFRTAVAVHPDIILVDLGLPDVDGLTLVSWLRRVPELARTPIVALTAWPRRSSSTWRRPTAVTATSANRSAPPALRTMSPSTSAADGVER